MPAASELITSLLHAAKLQDGRKLDRWTQDAFGYTTRKGWTDEFLALLLDAVRSKSLVECNKSWHVFKFLFDEVGRLSEPQRKSVCSTIGDLIDVLIDPMAVFCSVELLAEGCSCDRSLNALVRLSRSARSQCRGYAAYGFGLYSDKVRTEKSASVIRRELGRLRQDQDADVRREAEASIAKLSK